MELSNEHLNKDKWFGFADCKKPKALNAFEIFQLTTGIGMGESTREYLKQKKEYLACQEANRVEGQTEIANALHGYKVGVQAGIEKANAMQQATPPPSTSFLSTNIGKATAIGGGLIVIIGIILIAKK